VPSFVYELQIRIFSLYSSRNASKIEKNIRKYVIYKGVSCLVPHLLFQVGFDHLYCFEIRILCCQYEPKLNLLA
jgi:hypothetical protein